MNPHATPFVPAALNAELEHAPVPIARKVSGSSAPLVAAPAIKKVKFGPSAIVPLHHEAFDPPTFALKATAKRFDGGNLWTPKDPIVRLSIPIRIAQPLSDQERFGAFRLCIQPGADTPETCDTLRSIDAFIRATVEHLGGLPAGARHFPLVTPAGWVNFKMPTIEAANLATPDGRDWSQLKRGEVGVLKLHVRGIWRSEELGGYGLMFKLLEFVPTEPSELTDEDAALEAASRALN